MRKRSKIRQQGGRAWAQNLGVERLEPRQLLSMTWLVNSTADTDTPGTLRNAVLHSTAGDMVTFDPTAFPINGSNRIELTSQLEISQNLTIQGLNPDQVVLDCGTVRTRAFKIDTGVTASISGLQILRGDSSASDTVGGGLLNDGTLTLANTWVDGCSATLWGGGLMNFGTATLINDTFSENSANMGSGVYNGGNSIVIEQCTFSGNVPSLNTGDKVLPGAFQNSQGTASLTDCTISGNLGGLNEYGGGLVTLNNDIVAGNDGSVQGSYEGGNVFIQTFDVDHYSKQIPDYTGSNNLIGVDTGNQLVASNHNVIIGTADPGLSRLSNYGGHIPTLRIFAGSPAIDIGSNALIPQGIVTDQRGYSRIADGTVDAGAYEYGGVPVTNPPPLVVNSMADGIDYAQGTLTLRQAIEIANFQSTPQTITFDPSVFTAGTLHTITLDGQALEFSNTNALVTVAGPGQGVLAIDVGGKNRIVSLDGNALAEIDGVALLNGATTTPGGAIDDEGTLTLNNVSITNSKATGANGGAIYSSFGSLTLNGCTITGNSALNGGGIYATSSDTVTVNNSTISNNLAPGGAGGGIDSQGALTLANSTISGNSVAKTGSTLQLGGGLALGKPATITASTISGNSADGGRGGGIFSNGNGQLTITNSTIYGNTAAGTTAKGGGIYNDSFSDLLAENSTIASNASGNGGGIYINRGDVSLYNTIVAQNTASISGGANDVFNTLDYDYSFSSPDSPVGPQASSNNLIDDAASAGGLADGTNGNIIGHAAMLGALGNNGGPTQTVVPLAGSPAIDAGSNALANDYSGANPVPLTTDQRGASRIYNSVVDMGAVETSPLVVPTGLTATGGADEVQLSWTAVGSASAYEIFRGSAPGAESATPVATVASPSYLDTAVKAGTSYYYVVEAVSGGLTSPPSAEASATPFLPVINASPAGDTITLTLDTDGVHIDWGDLSSSGKVLIGDPVGLTINAQGGADTINLSGSGIPLPALLKLNSAGGNFTLNGLPSTGDPLAGKTIDLGTSTMYVGYTGSSSEQLIRQYLKNGLTAGATDAITSSAATALYGIGYADSADPSSPDTHPGTVELKYTVYGDANLDGTVNLADFLALARNFGQTTSTWVAGDFNYDGSTNLSDLLTLVRNFGKTAPPPPAVATALGAASNPISGPLARRRV